MKWSIEDFIPTTPGMKGDFPQQYDPKTSTLAFKNGCNPSTNAIWTLPLSVVNGYETHFSSAYVDAASPGPYRIFFQVTQEDNYDWDYLYCGVYEQDAEGKWSTCTEKW